MTAQNAGKALCCVSAPLSCSGKTGVENMVFDFTFPVKLSKIRCPVCASRPCKKGRLTAFVKQPFETYQ